MITKKIFNIIIAYLSIFLVLSSCAHKTGHKKNNNQQTTRATTRTPVNGHTVVSMREVNGVYYVPIKVNGLDLDFIFDTGASSISISQAEAIVMLKQGKITEGDIKDNVGFQTATGEISIGTIINLKTVEIGGIVLNNVEASVVDNVEAPLLLGQTALSKFGKVTINYNNNTIEFN